MKEYFYTLMHTLKSHLSAEIFLHLINKCKKTYQFKTHCKDDVIYDSTETAKIFWVTVDGATYGASVSGPMHSYI